MLLVMSVVALGISRTKGLGKVH